ncbi:MAG: precorrin-8X methylmutase [Nitrososphaerales archaeon]
MASEKALDIEKRSMAMIEEEVGKHSYNELEWVIVRRIIHATADFDFARQNAIIFHKNAIASALNAIANKCAIVGDSDIVLAALNKKNLNDFGVRSVCNISDAGVAEEAKKLNRTRAEVAMRRAAADIQNGIVAIGNAPTALYEVIRMFDEGVVKPSLIIGIPVGFVAAVESKEALLNVNVPYITNKGRKGGSTVAASIINALLGIYRERKG